jgi:nucleotide-binding universal stress UspA family protein
MYKRILVPLDGSVLSESILGHVKAIATACNVPEVVLLRVVGPIEGGYEIPKSLLSEMQEKSQAVAEDYISNLTDTLKKEGIAAKGVVIRGRAPEEILDYAKNNQVDLVIMSTHGRSGISRWFLGSVTNRVVRRCVAPVLVASPFARRG